jgi:predicted nucleotide-binding protein
MKVKELIEKIEKFKKLLEEHYDLWSKSLASTMPDYPVRNIGILKQQQKKLYKLFYQIDDYLTKYSKGRIMVHQATRTTWDIYQSSIGNDVAQIKGPSLRNVILELEGIIALLETKDPQEEIETKTEEEQNKRIFISHGGKHKALEKVKNFLISLDLEPVIVEEKPSEGKSVDDLVEERMKSCSAVIILATKDDKIEKRKKIYYQPRQNVIHEIGLAQQIFGNKIIYLKEKGCEFPSNINPKVWENFTRNNMENAFIKINKELKAFDIIK